MKHQANLIRTVLVLLLTTTSFLRSVCGECYYARAASIKLVLQTRRNATGHRNVKVVLETRGIAGSEADLGGLEAVQEVSQCDDVEVVSTTSTITASPARVRPPGYELFPSLGYYKMHTTPVTWDEAYHICVKECSLLMMADTEAESFVVKQLLNRKLTITGATWNQWVWAGFHDKGVEGEYLTVEGTKVKDGYTKWIANQPDNSAWGTEPDQDCGGINNSGQIQDLPCLGKLPFICEQHI